MNDSIPLKYKVVILPARETKEQVKEEGISRSEIKAGPASLD
jgi:hypothetical protein